MRHGQADLACVAARFKEGRRGREKGEQVALDREDLGAFPDDGCSPVGCATCLLGRGRAGASRIQWCERFAAGVEWVSCGIQYSGGCCGGRHVEIDSVKVGVV